MFATSNTTNMEKDLTPEESLATIQAMINQAKQSFHRMSFYFLLWGVLLIGATLFEFAMASMGRSYGWVAWPVMGVGGGIASSRYGSREGKRQASETMMDRVFLWIWTSFVLTMIVLIACTVLSRNAPGPAVTILTGLPTFATGTIIRFKPLVLGGMLFWVIGGISFFTTGTTGALLFVVAMLFGYIVPGYLLKRKEDGLRTT
jgi:hypothetical protein